MSKKIRCLNLDNKLLNKLLKHRLITCQDVLLKGPLELINILTISYTEAVELLEQASHAASIKPITALELMQRRTGKIISSGLPGLDKMLSTGLPIAAITEVAGPPGCGKTQLCLTIVASILTIHRDKSVIYVDTEGAFDPLRLLEIAKNKFPNKFSNQNQTQDSIDDSQSTSDEYINELSNLANRVIYLRENSCENLLKRLDDLEGFLLEFNGTLIIIDSIASIIRREFDCTSVNITHRRNKVLNRIVSHLKMLAENYDIPILVINQISTNLNNEKRKFSEKDDDLGDEEILNEGNVGIALGPTWAHAVNTRIVLQFSNHILNREMILVKSPNSPHTRHSFTIEAAGIVISGNSPAKEVNSDIDINNFKIQMRSGITY